MFSTKHLLRYAAEGSLLSLVVGIGVASAQTAAPAQSPAEQPDAEGVGEIIVTAQKRSERINDVPLSITAATGEELAKVGATDASQLVKVVPGFSYQLSPYGTPVFGIRGVSFFDASGVANPAVSVYVDQVPLPLSILTRGASLDVERVEVLKGPQGTLFGENATGGAINYIAAKPTREFAAGADALYGRFNQTELSGFVSGPLSDTLGVRIAARTEQRDDWQRATTRNETAGQRNFTTARLLLDWNPGDIARFELNINGFWDRSDAQPAQFQRFAPSPPTPASPTNPTGGYPPAYIVLGAYGPVANDNARQADWDAGFNLKRHDNFFQVSLRSEFDVSDQVTVTSLTNYSNYEGTVNSDPDGTNYPDLTNIQLDDFNIFTQELRASYDNGPLKLIAGGYYQYANLDETAIGHIESAGSFLVGNHNTDLRNINNQTIETYAFFGGVDYDLGNGIKVQGSARYTKQDRDFLGCSRDGGNGSFAISFTRLSNLLRGPSPAFPAGLGGPPTVIGAGECFTLNAFNPNDLANSFRPAGLVNQSLNQDNFSWKAGVSWEPNRQTLLYVNATKGYKAGGFSTQPYAGTWQIDPVTQESVQAYEAGFKLTLLDGRMQLNGAAFHYDYKNKQIQGYIEVPPLPNLPGLVNVPKSKIDGAELSMIWEPVSGLRINASGTYLDARVTGSFVAFDPFAVKGEIKGEDIPATPKWQTNLDVEYSFDAGSVQPYVGAGLSYQSHSYSAFFNSLSAPGTKNEFKLPSRALLDLRAGAEFADGRWRLEAFGRNITNKYYWVNVSHQTDMVTRLAGMPATYGVRATFRY